jgi:serine/threonine protein kinase
VGSLRYRAPEVIRHEAYGVEVDVYSPGMLPFELLACEEPYAAIDGLTTARELAKRVAHDAAFRPDVHTTKPIVEVQHHDGGDGDGDGDGDGEGGEGEQIRVPATLMRLLRRCSDHDPDRRPTAREVVEQLAAFLGQGDVVQDEL